MIMIVDVEDKSVQKPPVIMQEVFVCIKKFKEQIVIKENLFKN